MFNCKKREKNVNIFFLVAILSTVASAVLSKDGLTTLRHETPKQTGPEAISFQCSRFSYVKFEISIPPNSYPQSKLEFAGGRRRDSIQSQRVMSERDVKVPLNIFFCFCLQSAGSRQISPHSLSLGLLSLFSLPLFS